jgi:hypothetical protein
MTLRVTAVLALGFAGGLGLFASPATAAPQALGIVASLEPTKMTCDAAGCRAEFTAFCLQQARKNPQPNITYHPLDGAELTLVGRNAAGETVRVPAGAYLQFHSIRGFTAIEATIAPEAVAELGLTDIGVEVGKQVSLLPEAKAGDADPQTPEETALATGANRAAAVRFYDDENAQSDAMRVTSAMINALPEQGRRPSDSDGSLWGAQTVKSLAGKIDPAGLALSAELFATCQSKVDITHHIETMRECLQGTHDRVAVQTNIKFWESLGGS